MPLVRFSTHAGGSMWRRKPVLFYGVNSEGLGHATRARPVIEALSRQYDVHIFCGGRAREFLMRHFPNVHRVWWGKLVYTNNTADIPSTAFWSVVQGPYALLTGALVTAQACLKRPVAVVSDFEPITAWAGMLTFTPVITLDNQMLLKHGALPALPSSLSKDARLVSRVMFFNTPVVRRALISSFFQPGLKRGSESSARYVPLAVREGVLARMGSVRTDGPILVYQTSTTNHDLPITLRNAALKHGLRFVVYGTIQMGVDAQGGVQYREFSEERFLDDLARAPFVIINGGHSTIVEALALRKPVLAEPVRHQFEQAVNVVGLQTLGIGRGTEKLSVDDIVQFAADVPKMRQQMEALRLVDNEGLIRVVFEAVAEVNPARAAAAVPAL